MTFILKYRQLKRLFKSYYNYLISADRELTSSEKIKLIEELSRISSRIEQIEEMSFHEAGKPCYHWDLEASSALNRKER